MSIFYLNYCFGCVSLAYPTFRSTTDESVQACRDFTESVVEFVRAKNTELAGRDLGWFLNLCRGTEKPEDVFGANLPLLRKTKTE